MDYDILKIREFLKKVQEIYDTKNQQPCESHKYDRDNLFTALRLSELRLSRFFAYLLDPKAGHDQGSLFLNAFFDQLKGKKSLSFSTDCPHIELNQDNVNIETEVSIKDRRRIDILIEDDHWIIGLENKPYAYDQKDQLKDYSNGIKKKAKKGNKNWIVVYLSDQEPCKESIPQQSEHRNKIFVFNSSDWIECLTKTCLQQMDANHWIHGLVNQYVAYLDQQLKEQDMPKWYDELIENEVDRLNVFKIANQIGSIKEKIRSEFLKHLRKDLNDISRYKDNVYPRDYKNNVYLSHPKTKCQINLVLNKWGYLETGYWIPQDLSSDFKNALHQKIKERFQPKRVYKEKESLTWFPDDEEGQTHEIRSWLWGTDQNTSTLVTDEGRKKLKDFLIQRVDELYDLLEEVLKTRPQ